MFGNPETTTGGRALKFFASMRIDVRKVESIKSGDQVLGNRIGQGRENVKTYLEENPQIMEKIEGLLLDMLKKDSEEKPETAGDHMGDMLVDEDGVIIEE